MGIVTICDKCGGETRPYDNVKDQPCRACLIKEVERLRGILAALPHDAEGEPVIPGEHRWVIGEAPDHRWCHEKHDLVVLEVVVEGIGKDHDVLVGGLPGVDDDTWEVLDEELHGTREAAEKAKAAEAE